MMQIKNKNTTFQEPKSTAQMPSTKNKKTFIQIKNTILSFYFALTKKLSNLKYLTTLTFLGARFNSIRLDCGVHGVVAELDFQLRLYASGVSGGFGNL
ncbi:hypothetical protein B5C00_03900 [Staphylococcus delphini]|uniref:hypothetical protein n=1 Tax=Staphylococcus delphini TaxID=53344 RepID=UPI000BC62B8C|nr:hypothetical protein [Staphylococcus delphini]PCF34588.1 hypothetical protein B5C00_03900 [Staphylococcus delphini]